MNDIWLLFLIIYNNFKFSSHSDFTNTIFSYDEKASTINELRNKFDAILRYDFKNISLQTKLFAEFKYDFDTLINYKIPFDLIFCYMPNKNYSIGLDSRFYKSSNDSLIKIYWINMKYRYKDNTIKLSQLRFRGVRTTSCIFEGKTYTFGYARKFTGAKTYKSLFASKRFKKFTIRTNIESRTFMCGVYASHNTPSGKRKLKFTFTGNHNEFKFYKYSSCIGYETSKLNLEINTQIDSLKDCNLKLKSNLKEKRFKTDIAYRGFRNFEYGRVIFTITPNDWLEATFRASITRSFDRVDSIGVELGYYFESLFLNYGASRIIKFSEVKNIFYENIEKEFYFSNMGLIFSIILSQEICKEKSFMHEISITFFHKDLYFGINCQNDISPGSYTWHDAYFTLGYNFKKHKFELCYFISGEKIKHPEMKTFSFSYLHKF